MKKLFALLLLLVLLPTCALAYRNPRTGLSTDTPTPFYGTLKEPMSTRMGPGTEYVYTGSYGKAGDRVKVISIAYDINDVSWVQVEVDTPNGKRRVYTGAKRFDYIDRNAVCVEEWTNIAANLHSDYTPYWGPGVGYAKCDFWLSESSPVLCNDIESGFCLCDFYYDGERYRVFIPSSGLN